MEMRVLFYGEAAECDQAVAAFCTLPLVGKKTSLCTYSRESFRDNLVAWLPSLIVVLADRSEGMDGVYLAKQLRPELPLFWFSDDKGFGMQSHRLGCDYFAVKPFTVEKLCKALRRCCHMGIRIGGMPAMWE